MGSRRFPFLYLVGRKFKGSAHLSSTYVVLDSPKAVLSECSIFRRVVNLHMIGSLGVLACCILREAMLWTNRL